MYSYCQYPAGTKGLYIRNHTPILKQGKKMDQHVDATNRNGNGGMKLEFYARKLAT